MKRKLLYCLLIVAATFAFNKATVAQSIADGYYFIKSAYTHASANSCIYDPQSTEYVKIHTCENSKYDIFKIEQTEEGKYTVRNAGTGRYVIKFVATNSVLLSSTLEEDTYIVFDKVDDIYRWKDNKQ
ncbi:MAG: RICIN domain-containing protein, partial [Bacteroidaceae bacterium]